MPILFEGKYRRARKFQREQRDLRARSDDQQRPLADEMEKGDLLAMIIAACVTILPVALLVLAALAAAGYFFIVR